MEQMCCGCGCVGGSTCFGFHNHHSDGTIAEKDLLIFVKAEIIKVDWNDIHLPGSMACRYGGGVYLVDANEVRNNVNIPNSMASHGGGLFTYSESPYRSAEANSPDVNSARRR